jgi:succinate dehydrogenase/fumarate reductase flavoprotein subunit
VSTDFQVRQCDILIIGGGGSGALAAVEAAKQDSLKIVLASKGPIGQSGLTPTANGGTAFHSDPDGTFQDMVKAGCFLNDQSLVWTMATEAEHALETLKGFGISTVPIRAISRCVLPDELLSVCRRKILNSPNVALLEHVLITRLITSKGAITAATALDLTTGDFFIIQAKAIIIATGGLAGELYPYTSNNPFGVTTDASGTGHAMAYLAGADMIDMEMIQFVPLPGNPECLNLRYFPEFWNGPYKNRRGEVIESNVAAYHGASYSHQFVQKIFREIEKGNGPITVDRRDVPRKAPTLKVKSWARRRKFISKLGLDPHENKIEIVIGSHFGMGGIKVTERTATTIPGLFAAGEVMGGVHGALRLSGYSFTQMIVFGFQAGKEAARYALGQQDIRSISNGDIEREKERVYGFLEEKENSRSLWELKKTLQGVMQKQVFVFREKTGLEKAKQAITDIKSRIPRLSAPGFKRFNLQWARALEFSLMVEVAEVITECALAREESRGFHHRRDFPHQDDDNWLKHTIARRSDHRVQVSNIPVDCSRMKPEALQ